AQGDVATLGTFAAFALLSRDHSFWIAFPVALLSGAAVSVLFYFGALAPAQRKGATLLGQVILTIGLALIVQGFVVWAFGTEPDRMPFPLSDGETRKVGPVYLSQLSLGALGAALAACVAVYLVVQRTRLGLAMRAVSENLMAAQTLGIPTRRVLAFAWA